MRDNEEKNTHYTVKDGIYTAITDKNKIKEMNERWGLSYSISISTEFKKTIQNE